MAVKRLFTNNAVSLLQSPISAGATTLTVIPGHGAMFPSPGANEIFVVTLEDQAAQTREIVYVTSRSADVFTIVRGQEGTTPRAWTASSGADTLVDHRITAGVLYYLKDELAQASIAFADLTGSARDNPSLDAELDTVSALINDLNNRLNQYEASDNSYSNSSFPALTNYKKALDYLLAIPPTDLSDINDAITGLTTETGSLRFDLSELQTTSTEVLSDLTDVQSAVSDLLTDLGVAQSTITSVQGALASNNDYSNSGFSGLTNFKKALDYILAQPLGGGGGGGETLNLYAENSVGGVAIATGVDSVALGAGAESHSHGSLAIGDQSYSRLPGITYANGRFGSQGDAQTAQYLVRTHSIDANEIELFLDGTAGSQRLVLPDDCTWTFEATILGHQQDGNGHAGFRVKGVIYKTGSVNMLGAVSKETISAQAGWNANVYADSVNNSLKITATGETGKIIRWLAIIQTVEITN